MTFRVGAFVRWSTVLVLASACAPLAEAAGKGTPDLVQDRASDPPVEVAAGAGFKIRDRVRNRGRGTARPSRTRYFLSLDRKRGRSDIPLRGRRSVPRLHPGRDSAGLTRVRVPITAPLRSFRLIVCANDPARFPERRRRNNCRPARTRVKVVLPRTCPGRLKRSGISFTRGPSLPGVTDPVTVVLPLSGISYLGAGGLNPEASSLFMDCTLALALHRLSGTLKPRGITSVVHGGIYEYRCIAGTDPCVLSQHARATAIDLLEFRAAAEPYNVETDWVIDPDEETTCSAQTNGPKDTLLHELVCEWDAINLFNTILTPNYNEDHRDHIHVDLTPGRDYIN